MQVNLRTTYFRMEVGGPLFYLVEAAGSFVTLVEVGGSI